MQSPELKAEVLIIGAGVVGSSVAMNLAQLGARDIVVVDFDMEGALSSSELNAGGVRATLTQPVNIELSRISIDYFADHAAEVGYRACGYLWLHSPERLMAAERALEVQKRHGWPVEVWDVAKLRQKVPFIDKTDGIAAAYFAPKDGLINPNRLKSHFREKAKALGVRFEDRIWIKEATLDPAGVSVKGWKYPSVLSADAKMQIVEGRGDALTSSQVSISADRVVNCAGAWAAWLARSLGYSCDSKPIRRQISVFDSRDVDLSPYGMIVDTSGVYFHPEASNGMGGFAPHGEVSGVNYSYDGSAFFEEHVWPALFERSSAFERLRHLTGWAGLYEVSRDESAILGRVEEGAAGKTGRIFDAHSFSGHGVMQSYGAGLALAELMVRGKYETLDATELAGSRFERGREVREGLVI